MSTPISEKFLDRRDFFALSYRSGLVFLEVMDWEHLSYKPYNQISSVSPESSSDFQRLEDSSGDDVLFIESNSKKVLHGSIGIDPGLMRVYTRYPEGTSIVGTWPNLTSPSANSGDRYGYSNGNDSPYNTPTEEFELAVPPGERLSFSFYNTDNRDSRQPVLNLKFREYNVNVLDPSDGNDLSIIKQRILKPGSPVPIYPVGSSDNKAEFQLQDEWKVEPMTENQIKSGSSGGGRR